MYKFKKGHEKGQTSIALHGMSVTVDHEYATQEQMKLLFEAGCSVVEVDKKVKE